MLWSIAKIPHSHLCTRPPRNDSSKPGRYLTRWKYDISEWAKDRVGLEETEMGHFGNEAESVSLEMELGHFGIEEEFVSLEVELGRFGNGEEFVSLEMKSGRFGNNEEFDRDGIGTIRK